MRTGRVVVTSICALLLSGSVARRCAAEDAPKDPAEAAVTTLVNYNFMNKGGMRNLSPEVFLGINKRMASIGSFDASTTKDPLQGKGWLILLHSGPSVAGVSSPHSRSDLGRSLMLPGNLNLSLGPELRLHTAKDKDGVVFVPLSVGGYFKVLDIVPDTTLTQYGIKLGASLLWPESLGLAVQYTTGDHDLTSDSGNNLHALFGGGSSRVKYVTAEASMWAPKLNAFITLNYRTSVGGSDRLFPDGGKRVLSLGVEKEFLPENRAQQLTE